MVTIAMLVPNMVAQWLHLGSEYISYIIGFILYASIYLLQMKNMKKAEMSPAK
jgi:hypothetical protein